MSDTSLSFLPKAPSSSTHIHSIHVLVEQPEEIKAVRSMGSDSPAATTPV